VAVTVWENRISPLFDATQALLIADIHNRVITEKHLVLFDCLSPFSRAATLEKLGINTLICGGVSDFFANLIEARNIRIISFVAGRVDQVIEAYLRDALCHKKFRMPGCGGRQYKNKQEEPLLKSQSAVVATIWIHKSIRVLAGAPILLLRTRRI